MNSLVFMGTPQFSVPILEGLIAAGYDVLAVVTQPDRPVGRKKVMTPPPVKTAALQHNIEVLQPEKISQSKEMERVLALNPDLIVTAAFGQFLPEQLLVAPKYGAINVHASLLPKYRGGAPVHYAIMNGEKETGVTIIEMVKKMDAGRMLAQKAIPITLEDDVGTMFLQLSLLGRELLLAMLPDFFENKIIPIPQNEAEVTFSPNIQRNEESLDWRQTAAEIDCKIRGLHPWPVAYTLYKGTRWKIYQARVLAEKTTQKPGTIIAAEKKTLKIAAGKGTVLAIEKLQPAGKAALSVAEFLNGVGQTVMAGEEVGK